MYSSAQILTCGKEKEEEPRPRQVLDEPLERPPPLPTEPRQLLVTAYTGSYELRFLYYCYYSKACCFITVTAVTEKCPYCSKENVGS